MNTGAFVKWKSIRTPHFNILYSDGFDQKAQEIANTMEQVYDPASVTLGAKPRPIPIVLRNRSSISNAFVSMTPRRSEFLNLPPQDYNFLGNNDWYDLIGVHEFRHVVQYQQANQGINRAIFYLMGYTGLAGIFNLTYPDWFSEGDAVVTETALTRTGRGSIPNFGLLFRTNILEGRTFNYHKQMLGSYKNMIPNHYVLGYHMVSYLREHTKNPMIWSDITERAANNSIFPFAFSNAIKKETGQYVTQLFNSMAKDLREEWQKDINERLLTSFDVVTNRRTSTYTDYQFPQVLEDGSVLALKSGIGDISTFVKISGNTESKVHIPGMITDNAMLSSSANRFVWVENMYHPRWLAQNYSVIKAYDFTKGKSWTVASKKSRYAAAAISPDGKKVVTIETTTNYLHHIVIIDLDRNEIVQEVANPSNFFYSMPRWSDDGQFIVMLQTSSTGKSVVRYDVGTGRIEELIGESTENIGFPVMYKNYLLYNSAIDGIDNIYALDLTTGQRFRITSSRYGSYNPALSRDGSTLFYNEQNRNGMDIVRTPFDPQTWVSITKSTITNPHSLDETIVAQENNKHLLDQNGQQVYPVRNYSQLKNMFNPYSWGPYSDNSFSYAEVGLKSQDILSTLSVSAGYRLDVYDKTSTWVGNVSYQGLFPIIDFGITYGERQDDRGAFGRDVRFEWKEATFLTGIHLPLLLTKSKYHTSLTAGNYVGFRDTRDFTSRIRSGDTLVIDGNERYVPVGQNEEGEQLYYLFTDQTDFGQLVYNRAYIEYARFLKQSKRDIYPKFGQYFAAENFSTPFGGNYVAGLTDVRGIFYFPGLFKHHSLYVGGYYQIMLDDPRLDAYTFSNRIFKPRGYSYPRHSTFYSLTANYSFPIWYPDIAIGPLVNLQRVKGKLFYDYGVGEGNYYLFNPAANEVGLLDVSATYKSFGGEVTVDFNIFRLAPQLSMGMRVTKIPGTSANPNGLVYEFLIGSIAF